MSLTLRLTITYLLITLAGVLLLGAGFVALAGRHLAEQRERELGAQAAIYAALLGELAATPAALQALAPARPGVELLAAGTAPRVFSTAGSLLVGDPALGPFPSRAALALVRPPLPLPASQVAGRLYAARPILGAAGVIGVVELSRDTADSARLMAALRRLALQAALGAAIGAAVVSIVVARSIARPILRLTRRAEELAATLDDGPPAGGAAEPAPGEEGRAALAPPPHRPRAGTDEIAGLTDSLARLDAGLRAYTARIAELEQTRASFYRGVSHELRTPLTAIRAGLENLADSAPPAGGEADARPLRPTIAMLEGEAARLSRLVEELLADGARSAGAGPFGHRARAPLDLSALAAEVCALLAGRAERAGVELRAAGAPLELVGNRDRLKQALINLVDNALRVTPPGGTVLVATVRAGARARLAVMDDGPGVPAELRERIWGLGARGGLQATDGSAGLGLAIVREIAAAHGGEAYLDERYGPGARFVIELPLTERNS